MNLTMKKNLILILTCLFVFHFVTIAVEPFRFAVFTDIHISPSNPIPSEDLMRAVADVNERNDLDFVLVSGDVTEEGDRASLEAAKAMLDKLNIPYYATAGNHETKWSESGATDFARIFGDDKFSFHHKGCLFVGFTTGPIIKMGDGHIAPQDIDWVAAKLKKTEPGLPVFAVTHYPLQTGDVDNWYDMTDMLRKFNVQALLGGHYHRNTLFNYDGIPGIIHRSLLRAKDSVGGYSILSVSDSIRVFEKRIGNPEQKWLTLAFELKKYDDPNPALRPSFDINRNNKKVREVWRLNTRVGIYTVPVVDGKWLYYGDDFGFMHCVSVKNGKHKWKFKTGSRIVSSPGVQAGKLVFGSTDGSIYCLNSSTGKLVWKVNTNNAVMGSAVISNDTVFIGGSDGCFRALNLNSGSLLWKFDELSGYVETRPVIASGKIYFGAWDAHFYALNIADGSLAWKWNNGQKRIHFSPAAVLPVMSNGKVFITAPDRFWTALNAETGTEVWRTNRHMVRETIGMSTDGNVIYSRCMNDSVVALDARADYPKQIWKTSADYGYDHNPSMLVERDGVIVFGTKNGLLHGIDARTGAVLWRYKIGNSIINTVTIISKNECVLTTTEGVVMRVKY